MSGQGGGASGQHGGGEKAVKETRGGGLVGESLV